MNFGTNLIKAANSSLELAKENAPLILMISSVSLSTLSTIMAVKATPEAYNIYMQIINDDTLSEKEKRIHIIKYVLPLFGPAALTGLAGVAAGITSYKISKHRLDDATNKLAALTPAYILATDTLKKQKEAIIEKYGEEGKKEIEERVAEKKREEAKKVKETPEEVTYNKPMALLLNKTLTFTDNISGQEYETTAAKIYDVCGDIELRLRDEDAVPLSDYLAEVGGNYNADCGNKCGWLTGDTLDVRIKDKPYINEKGYPVYQVIIDKNDSFAAYISAHECY